jgi:hypothetical protein
MTTYAELVERRCRRARGVTGIDRPPWQLAAQRCPADLDLIDYLRVRELVGRVIFHAGTGGHHAVARANERTARNHILGVTAVAEEHAEYARLVREDPAVALHYQVLLTDIYALSPQLLPTFDVATLFHLGESPPGPHAQHDDESLVDMFTAKLHPTGLLLFYAGSDGYERTSRIVADTVARGNLRFVEEHGSLLVYRRPF